MNARYQLYEKLREQGDFFWSDHYRSWCVMNREAMCAVTTDPRFSSRTADFLYETTFPRKQRDVVRPLIDYFEQWLFYLDPPAHTQQRRHFSHEFSRHKMAELQPLVAQLVADTCGKLSGEFDFMTEVAHVLPTRVLAHMLGLPDKDTLIFFRWTQTLGRFFHAFSRTKAQYEPALAVLKEQANYFNAPQSEWMDTVMLLTTGIETTMSFLGNGLYTLLMHPDVIKRLRADSTLMAQTADELLRLESPIQLIVRRVTEDMMFRGQQLKHNDVVSIFVGAVNRDPAVFPDPNTFNIDRNPNQQLAFGHGIHYCIGRLLARLIGRECFQYILRQWPKVQLIDQNPRWYMGASLHHVLELRLAV